MVSIQPGPTVTSQRPALPFRSAVSRACFVIFVLAAIAAVPALAENMLANPDFPDTILTPWTVDANGEIYWSAYDVQDAPGSGSLLIVDNVPFYAPYAYSECVPVVGNAQVNAHGSFRKGAAAPSSARVEVRVVFYSSSSCATWIGEMKTGLLVPTSSWSPITLDGVAPSGAGGMRMAIKASAGTTGADLFEFHGDALSLSHTGQLSIGVFVDGFEDGLITWSDAVGN